MIVHRGGNQLTACDSCYRIRPTHEPGWVTDPARGFLGARAVAPGNRPSDPARDVMQPPQAATFCPDCQ